MRKQQETYYIFNEQGERDFPKLEELNEIKGQGINPVLFLDSCVCLDLVKFADYKKNANVNKKRMTHFLDYIHKNQIEVVTFLGILELCHNRDSLTFDFKKFQDFKNRIDFLELVPLKFIHNASFDYERDYHIYRNIEFDTNSIEPFRPLLMTTYCCLLKIREISLSGLKKHDAKRNIEDYLYWSEYTLNRIMGIENQLALNIFGGVQDFRKMIWIDNKQEETKKRLWGSAWDIFHARMSSNNYKLSEILDKNMYSMFVTQDYNLFNLCSQLTLKVIFENKQAGSSTSMLLGSFDFPHLDRDYVDSLNRKSLEMLTERVNIEKKYDESELIELIKELEKKNNIA